MQNKNLLVLSAVTTVVHVTTMEIRNFGADLFDTINIMLMIIAVPPLALVNSQSLGIRTAATWTCTAAGSAIALAYPYFSNTPLFCLDGQYIQSRILLCSFLPFFLLVKRISCKSLLRIGVSLLIITWIHTIGCYIKSIGLALLYRLASSIGNKAIRTKHSLTRLALIAYSLVTGDGQRSNRKYLNTP